eukprot:777665_1
MAQANEVILRLLEYYWCPIYAIKQCIIAGQSRIILFLNDKLSCFDYVNSPKQIVLNPRVVIASSGIGSNKHTEPICDYQINASKSGRHTKYVIYWIQNVPSLWQNTYTFCI